MSPCEWFAKGIWHPGAVTSGRERIARSLDGFWRYIVDGRYEEAFWLPALDAAFSDIPGAAAVDRRRELEQAMINLNKLRNRLAHHEPICKPTTRRGPGGVQLTLSVGDV